MKIAESSRSTEWTKQTKLTRWTVTNLVTLATLCLAQSGSGEINNTKQAFLKPGASYEGKTASTRIANTPTSVAVLLAIDNWTKYSLIEPEVELTCGKNMAEVPPIVLPGLSEMVIFEKGQGFTGVCIVVTYMMDFPPDLEPHYIQVMMSVPYNLNSFSPYLAVGVTTSFLNTTDLFNTFYYYSGPFDRQNAGTLAEYTSETNKVMLRGTMEPDKYKPILRLSVLPVDKEADGFHAYSGQPPQHCRMHEHLLFSILLVFTSLHWSLFAFPWR